MSKFFDHTNHKALWQWLAETGEVDRMNWPRWKTKGGDVEDCLLHNFACAYTHPKLGCLSCPLEVSEDLTTDEEACLGGLLKKWVTAGNQLKELEKNKDYNYRAYIEMKHTLQSIAMRIAELPAKPGIKTK